MVTIERQGDKLIITADISGPGQPSASGKTTVLASTHGAVKTSDGINVNLNIYKAKEV